MLFLSIFYFILFFILSLSINQDNQGGVDYSDQCAVGEENVRGSSSRENLERSSGVLTCATLAGPAMALAVTSLAKAVLLLAQRVVTT